MFRDEMTLLTRAATERTTITMKMIDGSVHTGHVTALDEDGFVCLSREPKLALNARQAVSIRLGRGFLGRVA